MPVVPDMHDGVGALGTGGGVPIGDDDEFLDGEETTAEGVLSASDAGLGPELGPEPDPDFERLLAYLIQARGFDFTAYKRATLTRRVSQRLQSLGLRSFAEYIDHLEVHPGEFEHLFNTVLINVTSFFRDEAAWEFLAAQVIPGILGPKASVEPVRCWVAGCASGEEAYTLAMVLAEAMGADEFSARAKIYATDLNNADLNIARQATYNERAVSHVPARYREKYFRRSGHQHIVDPDLRRNVIFGRHDLLTDSPISRVDLLTCRNTLMYFNGEAQTRVLQRFHFAMAPAGCLFLGKAEMLLTNTELFTPVDLKRRVFVKVPRPASQIRAGMPEGPLSGDPAMSADSLRLREAALQSGPVAQVLVDAQQVLVAANARARALFSISADDLGRYLRDLPLARRPADLRTCTERAAASGRPLTLNEVEWESPDGEARCFDVQVVPLMGVRGETIGTSTTFTEVTLAKRLREDLQQACEERETTHEELQTTNEELQSTIEELETTNEELQSTNEELETMNEELQSMNEELRTTNDQLRRQSEELAYTTAFWRSVMSCLTAGVVIVDRDFQVITWNARATDLWGLREDEVRGRNILGLDIGLPVDRLRQPIRGALVPNAANHTEVIDATNRRGRAVSCKVCFAPLRSEQGSNVSAAGVILMMEETEEPIKSS